MKSFLPKRIWMIALCVGCCQMIAAHPIGVTISQLKYSDRMLTFSTRIFYPDFYYELKKDNPDLKKNFQKVGVNGEDQKIFAAYFKKQVAIFVNKKQLKFHQMTIAFERHEPDAYVLVVDLMYKAKLAKGAKIKVRDTVLLNTIDGQKNMLNVLLQDPNTPSRGLITLEKETPEVEFVNE